MSEKQLMERFIVKVEMMVAIDVGGSTFDEVGANFYARLSELVQSEEHMLMCDVEVFELPALPCPTTA